MYHTEPGDVPNNRLNLQDSLSSGRRKAPGIGRSLAVESDVFGVAAFVHATVVETWMACWDQELSTLRRLWETVGEPAYGRFTSRLFRPVEAALEEQGFVCEPRLPGNLRLSEERWGSPRDRERRMWSLVSREHCPIGVLVTRFFHDHTALRLPSPPAIVGLDAVDHLSVRRLVVEASSRWG